MATEYQPLNSGQHEFRLLRVHPRFYSPSGTPPAETDSIQCDLFISTRKAPPEYWALSYTWGDPKEKASIRVNGTIRRVRRNLRTALEYIQQDDQEVIIWIDAICINQEDNDEKGEQVLHMMNIYASAKCTIVWLGLPAHGSDECITRCIEVGSVLAKPAITDEVKIPSLTDLLGESVNLPTETTAGMAKFKNLQKLVGIRIARFAEEDKRDFEKTWIYLNAFKSLMTREYWSRVWTHQEFVVSNDIVVQCGHSKIEVELLRAACNYTFAAMREVLENIQSKLMAIFENASEELLEKMTKWILANYPMDNKDPDLAEYRDLWKEHSQLTTFESPPSYIFGLRRRFKELHTVDGESTLTLIRVLASVFDNRTLQVTVGKDRIYGLLGMAADQDVLALVPEYDESVSHLAVYTQAARAVINAGEVDLLAYCQHQLRDPSGQEGQDIPSWVPDWSSPIVRPRGGAPGDTSFIACGNRLMQKFTSDQSLLPEQIKLSGWVVDKIEELAPGWVRRSPGLDNKEQAVKTYSYLRDIQILCNKSSEKMSSKEGNTYSVDSESAYFRVPIGDQERNDMGFIRPAGQPSRDGYASLVDPRSTSTPQKSQYLGTMEDHEGRLPFLSFSGYVGLAPKITKQGDALVIFCGAKLPYVLRGTGNGVYRILGEAYIHGVMYGEFVEHATDLEYFILE